MEESHIQDQQTVCCHAGLKAHHAVGQEAFFSDAGRGAFLLLATSFWPRKNQFQVELELHIIGVK